MSFDPPPLLTAAFVVLTLGLVSAWIGLVRTGAPDEHRRSWTVRAALFVPAWLGLHAAIAGSGIIEGDQMPPPVLFYLALTMVSAVALAFSPVGARLAGLPLSALVGLHIFRLPLEMILHSLHREGHLPVQMTWSGANFDVVTGASAAALAGVLFVRRAPPLTLVRLWNAMGLALLVVVVGIAITSAPTPLRLFPGEPAMLLPFHVPFTWIVSVHVWTALIGHLVIWRALNRSEASVKTAGTGFEARSGGSNV